MELKNKIIKALHEYAVLAVEWGTNEDPEVSLQEDFFEETAQEITELIMRDRYKMMSEYAGLTGFAQGCLEGVTINLKDPETIKAIKDAIDKIEEMHDKVFKNFSIEDVE